MPAVGSGILFFGQVKIDSFIGAGPPRFRFIKFRLAGAVENRAVKAVFVDIFIRKISMLLAVRIGKRGERSAVSGQQFSTSIKILSVLIDYF